MIDIEYKAYYENQIYKVKSIDFNHKKVNLNGGEIVKLENIELLPYIGIKDINQKKVHKGHIVKVRQTIYEDCSREEIEETREIIGEVVWHQYGWYIAEKIRKMIQGKIVNAIKYHSLWLWNIEGQEDDTMEIIGDRYNNPEMRVIK